MKQELKNKRKTLKNLKKAYDGLLELAKVDPTVESGFHMGEFGVFQLMSRVETKAHPCGSQGCLLGHMARIFPLNNTCFGNYDSFDYWVFGYDLFPSLIAKSIYSWEFNYYGDFLFSEDWEMFQPTFKQAMERLKYAIDMDLEIGDWEYRKESFIKE